MIENPISPSPDGPVLVIGAAGVDIVGRLRGELQSESSTPAQIRESFGGVARNVSENLARLGQPVTLITAVGDDEAGERLLGDIASAGVNVQSGIKDLSVLHRRLPGSGQPGGKAPVCPGRYARPFCPHASIHQPAGGFVSERPRCCLSMPIFPKKR